MSPTPGGFDPEMEARLEQREVTIHERDLEEELEGEPDPDAEKPGLFERIKEALDVFPDAKN
jgi:hypothetical protein